MIDQALMKTMGALVEGAAWRAALRPGARYRPGQPLRLLLAGYNGSRNTGADARVHELVRQLRALLGDRRVQLSVTTLDAKGTRGYFPGARQQRLSAHAFPAQITQLVHEHHGVLACEGSMFKSGFANALSTMMAGALGLARAEGKPAVGYGGEAGHMEPALEQLVRTSCRDAYVLARTEPSLERVRALGIRADLGTDTAWSLDVPSAPGRKALERLGWDGQQRVAILCPVNPFWWPVRPDPVRAARQVVTGRDDGDHARSIYFHRRGADVDRDLEVYLDGLAAGGRAAEGCFRLVLGMEALDRPVCQRLAARLDAPVMVSDRHDWPVIVSVLRHGSLLVSSRYHALVCSLPAGVPSIGVSHDERIPNLMAERGTPQDALKAGDGDLAQRCEERVRALLADPEPVREACRRTTASNLLRMGRMGQLLLAELQRELPDLPVDKTRLDGHPIHGLPALSPALESLLEEVPCVA